MLIAGIDEAGYGPLLGPLVITGISMKIPDEIEGLSLWELFSNATAKNTKKTDGKFVITDSKKLFRRNGKTKCIRELERSALGSAVLLKRKESDSEKIFPENLNELMNIISLEPTAHLDSDWYSHRNLKLPVEVDKQGLMLSAKIFERELNTLSAELTGVYTIPLIEKRYNRFAKTIRNKSQILFSQTARIIARIINKTNEKKIKIFIDKQGARNSYVNNLLKIFENWQLVVIKESDEQSTYRLEQQNKKVKICFTRNGEQYNMLTAWASIVSKYVRELFMIQFNKYWLEIDKTLKPTAGYWKDGQRFVNDIAPLMKKMKISSDELIRQL